MMRAYRCYSVETLDDPRVEPYVHLKTRAGEHGHRLFIAEGKFVVERMLHWNGPMHSLLIARHRWDQVQPLLSAAGFAACEPDSTEDDTTAESQEHTTEAVSVFLADSEMINELVGFQFHSGVLGCGVRPPSVTGLPRGLVERWSRPRAAWILAAPATTLADNLGAMVRHAAAFSADAVLVGPKSVDPWSRRSIRVSMGNVFKLPIWEPVDFESAVNELRTRFGFRIVGTALGAESQSLVDYRFAERTVLLFGSEGHGLDDEHLALCDDLIQIPMRPDVDSLNVATSAAIVAYELQRQRSGAKANERPMTSVQHEVRRV